MGLEGVKLTFVEDGRDVENLMSWLGERRDWLGFDTETTGVNLGRDRVRLAQFGDRNHGWAIPLENYGWGGAVSEVFKRYDRPIVMHNSIFDWSYMERDGVYVPQQQVHDTMVMAQLVTSALPIGLKPTAARLVDRKSAAGQSVLKDAMKKQGWDWATVPLDFPPYWQYGALDPVLTCRIAEKLWPKVQERYMRSYEIEMASIRALRDAQITGVRVDVPYAERMSQELGVEMMALQNQMPDTPRGKLNPGSPTQLVEFLQQNGATLVKKTESGKSFSVEDDVLKYWQDRIPVLEQIRRYRYCQKLKSSYFDNMLQLQTDEVVHPSIRVLGASKTGRMSITAPALQTLPKSKIGRSAFIARPGCTLMSCDFQGIEMRLLAHMAQDRQMMENYANGVDQHTWLAEQAGVTRTVAKTAGFAKIYGAGESKFAISAGLELHEAQAFLARYDQLYPGVAAFQEAVAAGVYTSTDDKRWGKVYTEFGRKLMVPKDKAYMGVNYRDQGTAGEVLKLKIGELANAGLGEFIRLPIHDEILFEIPDEQVPEVGAVIHEVMPERQLFSVALEIDMETCRCWGDLYD